PRAGSDGLMVSVQVRVELAVEHELARVAELQRECAGFASDGVGTGQKVIGPLVACVVEEIIADNCVIVRTRVHPLNGFTRPDCYRERRKSILAWDYDQLMTLVTRFLTLIYCERRYTSRQK